MTSHTHLYYLKSHVFRSAIVKPKANTHNVDGELPPSQMHEMLLFAPRKSLLVLEITYV